MRLFWLNFGYYILNISKWLLSLLTVVWLVLSLSRDGWVNWVATVLFLLLTISAFAGCRVLHERRYRIDLDGTKRYDKHSSVTHYRSKKW